MVTVRLAWVEPAEQLRAIEGEVADDAVIRGEFRLEPDASPAPPGVYRLASEEACFTLDPRNPLPVLLHEDNDANVITWVQPLRDIAEEAAVAEDVRKAVFDLVEARVVHTDVFSASAILTSTEEISGALHVVGRCVVIRPA